jgi:thiol-disulfide isomerase/thioredoxin
MTSLARPLAVVALAAGTLGALLGAQAAPTTAPADRTPIMTKGDVLDPIQTRGLNDIEYWVEFPKKGPTTVVLFFLSTCPHCQAMLPYWNEAFEKKPKDLKVVGVMLDEGSPGFFALYKISFPVLKGVEPRPLSRRLKLSRVPLTARVQPGGLVEDVMFGEPDPARIQQIFRAPGT